MFKSWFNFSSPSLLKEVDRFFETYANHPYQDVVAILLLKEIDQFFGKYPDHPYHNVFELPQLRQKLAAYVTGKMFDASEIVTNAGQQASTISSFSRSFEQQLQMENWIHAGMIYVLQENADWVSQMIAHEFLSTKPRKFRQI